jgi:hypothetical protein
MKLFLTVALSLTAIALIAHAQSLPNYPPPPYPPPGYVPPPPAPDVAPPQASPAATEVIPPPPSSPPPAQQAVIPAMPQPPSALQPQQQGNITFVSGGAGDEDRDALKQVESQYNLRLLFAARNGDYLADIGVTLADAHGNTVLDTIADGPIFYAHVPPGHYRLTVSNEGQSQSHDVAIGAGGAVSQDFYWAQAS